MTGDRLVIGSEDAQAVIDPTAGGRLASLQIRGVEVLVTEAPPEDGHDWQWGNFVLAPWAGNQRGGEFWFAGERHALEVDGSGEARHGLVSERAWTVVEATADRVELEIEFGPDSPTNWFTPGRVRQRFEIGNGRLSMLLEVHSDAGPMPAIAGYHPWFRRSVEGGGPASVDFRPESRLVPHPDGRRQQVGDLGTRPWSDLFTGVAPPRIDWPGGPSIVLTSDALVWVYFELRDHGFCIEPWTDEDNALSTTTSIAAPGEPVQLPFEIAWSS